MASGKTHAKYAVAVLTMTATASPFVAHVYGGTVAISAVAGAVSGWLVTPDADIPHITHDERRMIRRLSIVGRIWVAYWWPYGRIFRHRGISHAPLVGTLTRMLYLMWWLPLVIAEPPSVGAVLPFAAMWCVQDIIHLAADGWRHSWKL